MQTPLVESCCQTLAEVRASRLAGAGRVELCAELQTGGLTPSAGFVRAALAEGLPVMALIRVRDGNYVYSDAEHTQAMGDVEAMVAMGVEGVVVGCLTDDGHIHQNQLRNLLAAANGRSVTFHKAFDEARDLSRAYEVCSELGVQRILTSGGAPTALQGVETLAALGSRAGAGILAAGGIRAPHVVKLVEAAGLREIHARASAIPDLMAALRNSGL